METDEESADTAENEKEKTLLLQMLKRIGNNRSKASRMLKLSRTTFYEKLRKYRNI